MEDAQEKGGDDDDGGRFECIWKACREGGAREGGEYVS